MAEREWAGRWAAGSLPNDINNILYWAATAGRGRERSKEGRGGGRIEWGVEKRREMREKENLGKIEETVCGGQGVSLSGDFSQEKNKEQVDGRDAKRNKQNKTMREA